MTIDMNDYPVTAWPNGPIQIPELVCPTPPPRRYRAHKGYLLSRRHDDDFQSRALPDELYLREMRQLDLSDDDALADFATKFGLVAVCVRDGERIPLGTALLGRNDTGIKLRSGALRIERGILPAKAPSISGWTTECPASDMRLAIRWLRVLTDIAVAHWHTPAFEESPHEAVAKDWPFDFVDAPATDLASLQLLVAGVNAAARDASPVLMVDADGGLTGADVAVGDIPVYTALAMQLWNHVAEGAAFRTCELCEGLFVRQRASKQKQQHRVRGELAYCSVKCSNLAKVRRHRAKLRQAREAQA